LDHNLLDSYRAVNQLLAKGAKVSWATKPFDIGKKRYPAGSIIINTSGTNISIDPLAKEYHLRFDAGHKLDTLMELKSLKLGLYQPWIANMDEGWTRWVFDQWGFPYTTLHNTDIQNGGLRLKYDVIVLPSASSEKIMKGHPEGKVPSPYFGGIGKKGLTELQQFVNEGGNLITLNESCQLIIDNFNIPVQDIKSDYPTTEYYCPSGIFKVELDPAHPIAYGMEENTNVVLYNSPLLYLIPVDKIKLGREGSSYDHTYVIAKYPVSNPLMSGLLIGDHLMHGKPALIEVEYGKGKIILFGFRPQHRAQPHGTFMLFFNSIYYGAATADTQ